MFTRSPVPVFEAVSAKLNRLPVPVEDPAVNVVVYDPVDKARFAMGLARADQAGALKDIAVFATPVILP
jgi:hypothetical protein